MYKPEWISEEKAAERLNVQPRTLRRMVKGRKLTISFTTLNGRNYQYDAKGIEKVLNQNAIIYQ